MCTNDCGTKGKCFADELCVCAAGYTGSSCETQVTTPGKVYNISHKMVPVNQTKRNEIKQNIGTIL